MPESQTSQLNQLMEMLTQYLLQGKLEKQRMGGYQELEGQRHKNRLAEIEEAYINTIARDDTVRQFGAEIFRKKQNGLDTSADEAKLKSVIDKIAPLSYKAATGKEPSVEDFQQMGHYSDETFRRIMAEYGMNRRQTEGIEKVDIPGQALRGRELDVSERGATSREQEIGLKRQDIAMEREKIKKGTLDDQLKIWRERVGDITSFLQSEGVKKEGGVSSMLDILGFSSGKQGDPLSRENRGKLFTALGQIETKLAKGGLPNEAEINLIERARSTFQIEEQGGGLIDYEGQTFVREQLIRELINQGIRNGLSPETAEKEARLYVDTYIKK